MANILCRLLFLFALLLGVSLEAGIPVLVLGDGPDSAAWQVFLGKNGISNSEIVNIGQLKERDDRNGVLVIHGNSFKDAAGASVLPGNALTVLKGIFSRGWRILAMEDAGLINGQYCLTEMLCVGRRAITIPIVYPESVGYDAGKFTEISRQCMVNGADGLAFFTDVHLRIRKWKPEKPDMTPVARQIFAELESWKPLNAPMCKGLPGIPKVLYASGSWASGVKYRTSPQELAEYAQSICANAICFSVWGGGWYENPLYDSAYPFSLQGFSATNAGDNRNYLAELIEQCRTRNIQLWLNIPGMTPLVLKPDCKELQVSDSGVLSGRFCPYAAREYYARILELVQELLRKHPYVNVLALDEPSMGGGKTGRWRCFCPDCKSLFFKRYGKALTPESVIEKEGRGISKEFTEFRERIMVDCYFKPLRQAMDKVNPSVGILVWNPMGDDIAGINAQRLADAGVDVIFGREFQSKIDGPCKNSLKYKPRHFSFERLSFKNGDSVLKAEGVKLDLFNGANVLVMMVNGDFSYPAIVTANEGRTLYFAFNPLRGNEKTDSIIRDWLDSAY